MTEMKPKCRSCATVLTGVGGIPLMKHEYSKRDEIHKHMVSHYRRLYNAKAEVDNKPPEYFKPHYMPPPRPSLPEPNLPVQTKLTKSEVERIHDLGMGFNPGWNTLRPSRLGEKEPADQTTWVQRILLSVKSRISKTSDQDRRGAMPSQQNTNIAPVNNIVDKRGTVHSKAALNKNSESKHQLHHMKTSIKNQSFISSKLREANGHPSAKRRKQLSCKYCTRGTNKNGKKELKPRSPMKLKKCMSPETRRKTKEAVEKQKEELKYLEFIRNITQDILANNIYTNEGLYQIFEAHIEKNKGKLETSKMKTHVENLKFKLDVPSTYQDIEDPTEAIFRSIERNVEGCGFLNDTYGNICHGKSEHKQKLPESHNEKLNKILESGIENQDTQVLGLLQNMGFDVNMAEEICQCMGDKDFLSSLKIPGDVVDSETWLDEQVLAELLPLSITRKNQEGLKTSTSENVPQSVEATISGVKYKENEPKESQKAHQNSVGKVQEKEPKESQETNQNSVGKVQEKEPKESQETNQNSVGKVQEEEPNAVLVNVLCTGDRKSADEEIPACKPDGTGAGDAETCVVAKERRPAKQVEKLEECKKPDENISKTQTSDASPGSAAESPIGSDYSSMKDHDESGYDCSAERDESKESASEVEEEISDDLSQGSSSSISQLAERLRHFSVNSLPTLGRCPAEK